MFNYLRLSYNLLRLANSVLDRRKEKFKKELEGLDLNERELNETLDCLIGIKDHLVRKMCIHWLKKKSIVLPEDLPKVEKAKDLAKGNRGVDYLKFDSPVDIIDEYNKISPDAMKALYNKVDLGDGVTIYTVEESKEGQYAVRKLADDYFGETFDKWCIIQRLRNKESDKRDKMGMHESAENYWENYSEYPKRVAFEHGEFFAFCGNDESELMWWDRYNIGHDHIPGYEHLGDDDKFIHKYLIKGMIKSWENGRIDTDKLVERCGSNEILWEVIDYPDAEKRLDLVQYSDLPEGLLEAMSGDEDSTVREHVALYTDNIETLLELSRDEEYEVRQIVAENANTTTEILAEMFSDEDNEGVYDIIASHPNTSIDILVEMSQMEFYQGGEIYGAIAKNPNTPPDILEELASNENKRVRREVSRNPNTPAEALVELYSDEYRDVWHGIASNPNTPPDILIKMFSDNKDNIHYSIAQNPNAPEHILVELSKSEGWYLRSSVSGNIGLPDEILIDLSNDENEYVRCGVARNPSSPEEVLIKLSNDRHSDVRKAVAQNPKATEKALIKLSEDARGEVRQSAAENPNATESVLVKLSEDEDRLVRQSVAKNPNVSDNILIKLSSDVNGFVVTNAKENLRKRGINV